jgi:hypothetical protein
MNNRQCEKAKKNLRDNKVPGLVLYVGKRSKTFSLYRRVDGKPTRITLGRFPGMTVEQARRKALSLLDGIENGTYGKPTTLGELWDVYCDVKRNKKSLDQDVYRLSSLCVVGRSCRVPSSHARFRRGIPGDCKRGIRRDTATLAAVIPAYAQATRKQS